MAKPTYEELEAQVAKLSAQLSERDEPKRSGGVAWRRIGVGALILGGALSLAAADFALWANRNLVSTDGYVRLAGPFAPDSAGAAALVEATDDQIKSIRCI